MMLLVLLLQVAPAPVSLDAGQPAPYQGTLVAPTLMLKMRADRDACMVERDAARTAVVKLRALPDLLSEMHTATEVRLMARFEAFATDTAIALAKAPLPPAPEPEPWYRSPWLWSGVGAVIGGLSTWAVMR